MKLLGICPSRGRPSAAAELLAAFRETTRDPGSRLVFVVDADDATRSEYPGEVYFAEPSGSYVAAINAAVKDPGVVRDATAIGFLGDDNRPRTPGWDVILGTWLTENRGIAYGDDGLQHERLPTSWWVSRPIVDRFGLAPAGPLHFYTDNWWRDVGLVTGCLRYFPDVEIEHLHPLARKAKHDEIYDRSSRHAAHDRRWYHRWELRDKKRDVAILRTIVEHDRPRRVLADWHHPALWESLSILFEDRFGWQLYSPHGTEWLGRGWRFAHNGTPAEWYLTRPAHDAGDHFEITPAEYPQRPRKAVTWAQAQTMSWDYVLASVAQHQRSFAELARRFSARLIHQVGNARHFVDKRERQVVLASSTAVGFGIRYHEEFSREVFAYSPPAGGDVASFMLRMDTAGCDPSWISSALGKSWHAYGVEIDDPHYLAPMSKVAQKMAAAGWIWHDKKIGDGYGHVVHNAAAMGRPLIGHASHYKGMLAEPFWRDLETCIDLDRHPPERALRLLRAISADPEWHTAMGAEIAATFDRIVDFDGEAEAIFAALI